MNILQAIILGIIQGLTEFLPVSSSGHLVLMQKVLNVSEPSMTFDVVLHIGTLIPVFIIYRKDIWELIKKPFQKMTYLLIVATIPAVIAALLFGDLIDSMFDTGKFLAVGFFITALVLLYADKMKDTNKREDQISYLDALIIGCIQAVAIMPAISRSGSTISGALFRKIDRAAAAKFSFLMSIPAILGAATLQIKDLISGETVIASASIMPMFFGFVAAMFSGYLAISFMIKLIKESKLRIFSYYVTIIGVLVLIDQFVTKIFF